MGKIKNFFVIRVSWNIRNRIIQKTYTLFIFAYAFYMLYNALNNYNAPRGAITALIILGLITAYGLYFIKFKDKPASNQKSLNKQGGSDK